MQILSLSLWRQNKILIFSFLDHAQGRKVNLIENYYYAHWQWNVDHFNSPKTYIFLLTQKKKN